MPRSVRLCGLPLAALALLGQFGCASAPMRVDEAAQRKMLELLMPSRVEIVEPFTHISSFDSDKAPDGIELLVQAVNSLGNPGQMMAGDVFVELYEYVPASGDRKGRRLEHWDVRLVTADDQRRHWNRVTQMYEFKLRVDPDVIPVASRYVLAVTYRSPLGKILTDEFQIKYHPSGRLSSDAPLRAGSR